VTGRHLFTFDSTHAALWAEEIARDNGIPAEIVPAPPGVVARCNLALEVLAEDVDRLTLDLREAGVVFMAPRT